MGIMRQKYLFLTPSGKTREVDSEKKYVVRHSQAFADFTRERVDTYLCKLVATSQYPAVSVPENATPKEKARLRKIGRLKSDLVSATAKFNHLPRRESFSGLHWAGEIDRLQQELDKLGDKSERMYPEISIEVGGV